MSTRPFSRKAAQIARAEGMERAAEAANPEWWRWMMQATIEVARRKPFFFTDDMEYLRLTRQGPSTHENRALGPLMTAAKRAGICEPTDHWSPSSQRVNHGRFMRVWYSLLYEGPKVPRPRPVVAPDPRRYDPVAVEGNDD